VGPGCPPAIGGAGTWCAGVARWQASHGHAVRVLALRAVTDDELWGEHWSGAPRLPGPVAVGPEDVQDGVSVRRCAFSPTSFAVARLLSRLGLETLAWGQSAELCGRVLREARRAAAVHAHWAPGLHALAAWGAARDAARTALAAPPGAPLVCYLGRKSSAKSLEGLLRALPVVKHQPPPILALAGPSTAWFARVLREAPCAERIRDLPALSESA